MLVLEQVQNPSVPIPAKALYLKPFALSFAGFSHRDLRRISRDTEQKYAEFTKNAIATLNDDRLTPLVKKLSKIALLHDLNKHLGNDSTSAFDMLNAISELSDDTQDFLNNFLKERGFAPLLLEEVPAILRSEGAMS